MKVPALRDLRQSRSMFNFDDYRQYYSSLSFKDLKSIIDILDHTWPHQCLFDLSRIKSIFTLIESHSPGAINIIELGCHEGHLAKQILHNVPGYSIQSWRGYDLNLRALQRSSSIVDDHRFSNCDLEDWFYNIELPDFNLFVSTHTLEHMNMQEVTRVFDHIYKKALYLILEIPIKENGQDWRGYKGTHVLKEGRKVIRQLLSDQGYTCFYEDGPSWTTGWKYIDL